MKPSRLLLLLAISPAVVLGQAPIALERRVNFANAFEDLHPSVAMDQQGRTIVVWGSSGEGTVLGRAFDAAADALTDPLILNSGLLAYRHDPAVSVSRRGFGASVWNSLGETGLGLAGPFGRCVEPGLSFGCDIYRASEGDLSLNGVGPALDVSSVETVAIAWLTMGSIFRPDRLAASVFSSAGQPETVPFVVDEDLEFSADLRGTPRVAFLGTERLVVVWSELGVDDSGHGISARIFSKTGVPEGPAFRVSSFTIGDQLEPDVAANEDGAFVVVWEGWGQDGSDQGIFGQRFAPGGQKEGGEFQISSSADSGQFTASVDMDSAGRFAVSWTSFTEDQDTYKDIFARFYRRNGTAIGPQFWVSRSGLAFDEQDNSDIAISDSGLSVIAYESYRCEPEIPGACSKDVVASWFSFPCEPDEETLCLEGGRFGVRTFWKAYDGRSGSGQAMPLTTDSGGFWFFAPDNFEVMVKVVDGCGTNERFWIYAAGLTDLDVDLLVTDTWTGKVQVFQNPLGAPYTPVQEIGLFDICGALPPEAPGELTVATTAPHAELAAAGTGACTPSSTVHCLNGGRFRGTATWLDFAGGEGNANTLPLGDDGGLFWFFGEENLELAVKVIDACDLNDRYWVYAAGLTNVGVTLTVEDTERAATWSRTNPLGTAFPAFLDSQAFATCP